jgi:hypothetical protein
VRRLRSPAASDWGSWTNRATFCHANSTLAGGSSASDSVKYKVARVAFADDVISNRTSVTAVALRNLALTDADASDDSPAPLELLPAVLPAAITNLTLANALLSAFPSLVANFSSLLELYVVLSASECVTPLRVLTTARLDSQEPRHERHHGRRGHRGHPEPPQPVRGPRRSLVLPLGSFTDRLG